MSYIELKRIADIEQNPMRQLESYPYNEEKLEVLGRSIDDVGLWPSIVARKKPGDPVIAQQAFGHHRTEAARRKLGADAIIPVIIEELDDEMMLRYMGRENLEDYNADFLVMLETWEAALAFGHHGGRKSQDLDIARFLGWTRPKRGRSVGTTPTAEACAHASQLIAGGYLERGDLAGLSVKAVRELCGQVVTQHETLDKMAKVTKRPAKDVTDAKKIVGDAGKTVAGGIREGRVAPRDIRGEVDVEAYHNAKEAQRQTPLFEAFAKSLCKSLARMMSDDASVKRLEEIKSVLGELELEDDVQVVRRVALECLNLSERAKRWHTVFDKPREKIVRMPDIRSLEGPAE